MRRRVIYCLQQLSLQPCWWLGCHDWPHPTQLQPANDLAPPPLPPPRYQDRGLPFCYVGYFDGMEEGTLRANVIEAKINDVAVSWGLQL